MGYDDLKKGMIVKIEQDNGKFRYGKIVTTAGGKKILDASYQTILFFSEITPEILANLSPIDENTVLLARRDKK